MNKKVSLKEIVATKIVYAIILLTYYWMWARTDWKEWYVTVQFLLGCTLAAFFFFQHTRIKKYKKEGVDEMAERNLKRCDSFCLKLLVAATIISAWSCAILGHVSTVDTEIIGWIIVWSLLALSVIRTVMFAIMDSKGI